MNNSTKVRYLRCGAHVQESYDATLATIKKMQSNSEKKTSRQHKRTDTQIISCKTVSHYIDIAKNEKDEESWLYAAAKLESFPRFYEEQVLFSFMNNCPYATMRLKVAEKAILQIMKIFSAQLPAKREFLSYRLIYLSSNRNTDPAYFEDVVSFLKGQLDTLSTAVSEAITKIENNWSRDFPQTRSKKTHSHSSHSHKHIPTNRITHIKGGGKKRGVKGKHN